MNQQASFVALRFDGSCKHGEACQFLLTGLFGCVGSFLGFPTEQNRCTKHA